MDNTINKDDKNNNRTKKKRQETDNRSHSTKSIKVFEIIATFMMVGLGIFTYLLTSKNTELQKELDSQKIKSEYFPQLRFNGLMEVKNGDSTYYVVKLKNHSSFSIYLYQGLTKFQIDNQQYTVLSENIKKINPIEILKDSIVSIKVFSEKEKKFGYKVRFDYEYYSAKDRENIFRDSILIFDRSAVEAKFYAINIPLKTQTVTITLPPIDTIKKYNQIIKHLKQKLILDSKNSHNYYDLALAYRKIGEIKDAKINFIKCCELDPNNYSASYEIARILFFYEKYEESQEWITKSIQANSKFTESYLLLGYTIYNSAVNNSKRNFEKAYKLAPTDKRLIDCNKLGDRLIKTKFKLR